MSKRLIVLILITLTFATRPVSMLRGAGLYGTAQQQNKDVEDFEKLADLANSLMLTDIDSSLIYANQLLELSKKANNTFWTGRALNILGILNQINGNYAQSDSLYLNALQTFNHLDSTRWVANVYNNLGLLQSATGRFDLAIINYFKSLQIRKQLGNKTGVAGTLNKIGKAYCELGEYDKAEEFYNEALEIHAENNHPLDYPFLILNKGYCDIQKGDIESGVILIEQADSLMQKLNNYLGLGELHFVKGEMHKIQNQIEEALKEYDQALFYFEKIGNKRKIAKTRLSLAEMLFEKNKTIESIGVLDSVLMTTYLMGATDLELKALMFQAFLRAQLGQNYNRAILYKRYIKLSDSLNAVKQMEDLAKAENQYLVEQKEKELLEAAQKQKISDIKIKRNRMLAAILGILVLSNIFYSLWIERNRRTIKRLNNKLKTHQEDLESEVKQRTVELEEAMKQVVQSDKLKSFFLANLSHEIRTPLNSILGFSDLLSDILEPDKKQYVDQIIKSGEQLLEIIDRILQLSKFQSGSIKAYSGVFEPRSRLLAMHDQVLKMKQEFIRYVTVDLEINTSQNAPVLINSDPELITQVVLNLLHNAIKFTTKGKIVYGMRVVDEQVEIFVEDTGIGIHKADLVKIFTPFDQVEDVLTKTHRGIGLGLPLSAQIINLLNSKLNVTSEPMKGSRFSFRFPIYK